MPDGKEKRLTFSMGMLVVLGFYISMGALHIDPISSSLPRMAVELNAPAGGMIRVSSAYFLGNLFGYMAAGPLADLLGRKKTAILGLAFTISGAFLCYFSRSVALLIAGRAVMGLGASAAMCTGRAIGGDAGQGKASARTLSAMQVVSGCLAVIMPVLGNAVSGLLGWRRVFLMMMTIDLLLVVSTLLLVRETGGGTKGSGSMRTLLNNIAKCGRKPVFVLSVLAFGFGISTFYSYVSAASLVFQSEFGMTPGGYSRLYAFLGAMMVVGAFIAGVITKRCEPSGFFRLTVAVQFFAAVTIVVMYAAQVITLPAIAVCFGVITFTSSIVIPVGMSLALNEAGEIKGSTAAICGIMQSGLSWIVSTVLSNVSIGGSIGLTSGVIYCCTTFCAFFFCTLAAVLKQKIA